MSVRSALKILDRQKLTDFFIASGEDLTSLNNRALVLSRRSGVVDSDVDLLMLCNLEAILTGLEWESVFDRFYINPAREDGPEGPWIYEVSSCLLQALQKLTPEGLVDCANQWAETDEWTLREDVKPEKIIEVLRELSGMAEQAASQKKSLFIWTQPF
jgi:hypothetical protein